MISANTIGMNIERPSVKAAFELLQTSPELIRRPGFASIASTISMPASISWEALWTEFAVAIGSLSPHHVIGGNLSDVPLTWQEDTPTSSFVMCSPSLPFLRASSLISGANLC